MRFIPSGLVYVSVPVTPLLVWLKDPETVTFEPMTMEVGETEQEIVLEALATVKVWKELSAPLRFASPGHEAFT